MGLVQEIKDPGQLKKLLLDNDMHRNNVLAMTTKSQSTFKKFMKIMTVFTERDQLEIFLSGVSSKITYIEYLLLPVLRRQTYIDMSFREYSGVMFKALMCFEEQEATPQKEDHMLNGYLLLDKLFLTPFDMDRFKILINKLDVDKCNQIYSQIILSITIGLLKQTKINYYSDLANRNKPSTVFTDQLKKMLEFINTATLKHKAEIVKSLDPIIVNYLIISDTDFEDLKKIKRGLIEFIKQHSNQNLYAQFVNIEENKNSIQKISIDELQSRTNDITAEKYSLVQNWEVMDGDEPGHSTFAL